MSIGRRRELVEADHPRLSITRQCELVSISRSSYYGPAKGEPAANLELMRLIDEQFLETPWYGSRQMTRHLRRHGHQVNRKRVRRLMVRMGLQAIYQRPKTTVPHPEHKIWPYLLRDLTIDRPDQVWCSDITYIPMRRGFLYLVAVMGWATRKVVSWRLSNTMDVEFCIEAVEEAMARYGRPDIFNTDQGSQFTSPRFQGHSKKAVFDGCDCGTAIFGACHADGGEWGAEEIGDAQHGVAQHRHGLWHGAGSHPAGVFAQEDVTPPVQAVLDAPVVAGEREQRRRRGVVAVQAGDDVDGFVRDRALDLAGPLDAADLRHAGPVERGNDLAADGDAAGFDAPVPLLHGLRALTVRRRPVQGGRRGLALERRHQLRGEKRHRRRRRDRPSAPVGWL
ncbi:transposase (plasmid) [Azospirillum sp. B510]|nr:transposase [Azospirillum sp. B510]